MSNTEEFVNLLHKEMETGFARVLWYTKFRNWLTWEMFIQLGIPFEFTSKTGECFYLEICDEEGIDKIVIYNKIGFISNVFSAPVTKENYLEACKIAKKLFLGE